MPRTPVTQSQATRLISMLGLSAEDVDRILRDPQIRANVMYAAMPHVFKGVPARFDQAGKVLLLRDLLGVADAPLSGFQAGVVKKYEDDAVVQRHLQALTPPQQEVILRFYGLRGVEDRENFAAIARQMGGISRARVSGFHREALAKVRILLTREGKQDEPVPADIPVDDLGFGVRTRNILRKAQINTLLTLAGTPKSELEKIPNLGITVMAEIEAKLDEHGLALLP